jgi:hypothetical protein
VGWIDLLPLALNTSFGIAANTIKDGDSHQIWIRALDVMGHSKTQTTIVINQTYIQTDRQTDRQEH